jgi:hypothetical protein
MKDFTSRRPIAALSLPGKLLYTAFTFLTVGGLVSSIAIYAHLAGMTATATPHELYVSLVSHYFGPKAISTEQLLEITHAHLFTIPVAVLVQGHLLLLTSLGNAERNWLIALGIGGAISHIAAPWLVRAWGPLLAWSYPLSLGVLVGSILAMAGITLFQMWFPQAPRSVAYPAV